MSDSHPLRDAARVRIGLDVTIAGSDEIPGQRVQTKNISIGGCFLLTEQSAPVGTVLELVIELVDPPHPISANGTVMHTIDAELSQVIGSPAGMGVAFTGLDSEDEAALEALVARLRRSEGLPAQASTSAIDLPDFDDMPDLTQVGDGDLTSVPESALDIPAYDMPDDQAELEGFDEDVVDVPTSSGVFPGDLGDDDNIDQEWVDLPTNADQEVVADEDVDADWEEEHSLDPEPLSIEIPVEHPSEEPPELDEDDLDPLSVGDTVIRELDPSAPLEELDEDTADLMQLEPVGEPDTPDIVLALRAESDRMQNATFDDRLGLHGDFDRDDVNAAYRSYLERYHPDLFREVPTAEVTRLVDAIHDHAREARDGLLARLRKAPKKPAAPPVEFQGPTDNLYRLGLDAMARGHNKEAQELLTQAFRQDPSRTDIEVAMHLAWGALLKQYGRVEQAMSHYEKAAALDERCIEAVEELRGFNQRPDRKGLRLLSLFRKKRKKGM